MITVIMVALWNRADHYIFILLFVLSFFFFSSPSLSRRRLSYHSLPYFHTWCGLSGNLTCRSETCCMRLAENTGCKKVAKNRHLGTISQLRRAISLQLRHLSTISMFSMATITLGIGPHSSFFLYSPLTDLA